MGEKLEEDEVGWEGENGKESEAVKARIAG